MFEVCSCTGYNLHNIIIADIGWMGDIGGLKQYSTMQTEWVNEWMNEWMSSGVSEWVSTCKWMSEWGSKWVNGWI